MSLYEAFVTKQYIFNAFVNLTLCLNIVQTIERNRNIENIQFIVTRFILAIGIVLFSVFTSNATCYISFISFFQILYNFNGPHVPV